MSKLIASDSEDEKDIDFRVNEDYAARYNRWREKEELQKLKDKYGNEDLSDEDDSSDTSEDEAAQEITTKTERGFFRALSALKSKDSSVYQADARYFSDEESTDKEERNSQQNKSKAMTIKDYEREVVLKRAGKFSDDEEEDAGPQLTYNAEQMQLKQDFIKAADSPADEDLLTKREKTVAEKEKEERDYAEWLKGNSAQLDQKEQERLKHLHNYWNSDNLDDDEKFLRDFVLNRRWKDNEDADRIPTYDEIVGELDAEEAELEREATYERKYNFRYEEPDPEFLKSYPRAIGESVRAEDLRRRERRKSYKERKLEEKRQRQEEIKLLKNLKKKEIMERIDKIKQITGDDSLAIKAEDLEGDFYAGEYDRRMKELFANDKPMPADEKKPVFSDSDPDEDWDQFDPNNDNAETDKRKRKRTTATDGGEKLKEALKAEKPQFHAGSKTFEEYMDEYYALDYEDIIGDMPVRFKYRQVEPNDFGLGVDEIINAEDRELNTWVSLKKVSAYRTPAEEENDKARFSQKGHNLSQKSKILASLYMPEAEEDQTPKGEKKKKRRKRKKNVTNSESSVIKVEEPLEMDLDQTPSTSGTNPKTPKDKDLEPSSEPKAIKNIMKKDRLPNPIPEDDKRHSKVDVKLSPASIRHMTDQATDPPRPKKKRKRPVGDQSVPVSQSVSQTLPSKKSKTEMIDNSPSEKLTLQPTKSKKDKKRVKKEQQLIEKKVSYVNSMTDDRLAAYGLNPRRVRNTLKYSKKYNPD